MDNIDKLLYEGLMKMKKCFNGLTVVNGELTSRCNKSCWCCGRRKIDSDYPEIAMNYGDMDIQLVEKIAKQLPTGIVVQLHDNGEPTLYPQLENALSFFNKHIKHFDTNGKLIVKKADEIIGKLDTMTISVIENDPESDEQYEMTKQFLDLKENKKPNLIFRLLGNVEKKERWYKLPGIVATRILHHPLGSFKYKKTPTIPEIGICLDLLNHLVIDRFGYVYPCVRFDPKREGVIGDANTTPLVEIWNGEKRRKLIKSHIKGDRTVSPICKKCEYWGVPTSYY